jgi:hypothetical protein
MFRQGPLSYKDIPGVKTPYDAGVIPAEPTFAASFFSHLSCPLFSYWLSQSQGNVFVWGCHVSVPAV